MIMPINSSEQLNNITVLQLRGDYFFHGALFIPWAYFSFTNNKSIFLWLFIGLLVAGLSEGIQYLLPYRSFNINDILANSIGIFLGFAFSFLLNPFKSKS
ncbi:MAG: VanZ family protein [Nanoarchaeota archaeon]|nr:VanZ family protein [Nanoarchaeota archaeon]